MTSALMKMIQATSKQVDLHLLTSVPITQESILAMKEQLGVTIHVVRCERNKNPLQYINYYKKVRTCINEVNPHIVHVHGSWDVRPAIVRYCASRQNMVTIVSPHRGMSPELIDIDFWKSRIWRMVAYQAMMISKSTAVVAVSDKEKKDLLDLGLKRRIEVLPDMQEQQSSLLGPVLIEAYRKALDTSYRRFLLDEERAFLKNLVRKAVADEDVKADIPALNGLSFRRISFLAYDEGATELMQQGAKKADIYLPEAIDVENIPRYKSRKSKILKTLDEMSQHVWVDGIDSNLTEERKAVRLILQAKEMTFHRLTLNNWVELYNLFRYSDFNEEIVGKELTQRNLKGFVKRLQKQLVKRFELKEGYAIF